MLELIGRKTAEIGRTHELYLGRETRLWVDRWGDMVIQNGVIRLYIMPNEFRKFKDWMVEAEIDIGREKES